MKTKVNKKIIFNIFVIVTSVVLLVYFCISEDGLSDLLVNIRTFKKIWLFVALVAHFSNILIDAYLIQILTHTTENKYCFKQALKTSLVGQFFSAVTPGASGGQPMQIYSMKRQGIDTGRSTSSLVQKFLVYQTSITIYGALSILFKKRMFLGQVSPVAHWLSSFGFISQSFVIIVLFLFSFHKTVTCQVIKFIFKFLKRTNLIKNTDEKAIHLNLQLDCFYKNNQLLYKNKILVAKVYFLTFCQLTCMFVVPYFIYKSLNLHNARLLDMVAAQSFVTMASSFIPLPGGSGAAEGSFYAFFNVFFTDNTIKSAVLLWRFMTYFLTMLICAPFANIYSKELQTNKTF